MFSFSRNFGWLVLVVLSGGLFSACSSDQVMTQIAAQPATSPGLVWAVNENNKWVIRGEVPNAATRARLITAAEATLGAGAVDDQLGVSAAAGATRCGNLPAELFAWLKTAREISFVCRGADVSVGGEVADAETRHAYAQRALAFVDDGGKLSNDLRVAVPAAGFLAGRYRELHREDALQRGPAPDRE